MRLNWHMTLPFLASGRILGLSDEEEGGACHIVEPTTVTELSSRLRSPYIKAGIDRFTSLGQQPHNEGAPGPTRWYALPNCVYQT